MKRILTIVYLLLSIFAGAQNQPSSPEKIRQQMQQIRQNTNWDDPDAAKKANAEIKLLVKQLSGGQPQISFGGDDQDKENNKPVNIAITTANTKEEVVAIANRFYNKSYKAIDAVSKSQFDNDLKVAENEKFSFETIHNLTSTGAVLITIGNDHNVACVYLAAAVKAMPTDTLSINNFGAYLRVIDSTRTSLTVLLYANKLFNQSPVILTQIGCSYLELNDHVQGEKYLKEALKYDPDFGKAHTALCDLYLMQGRLEDAILELFAGVKGMGCSYSQAMSSFSQIQSGYESKGNGESDKEKFWEESKKQIDPSDALAPLVPQDDRVKMPSFPLAGSAEDWLEGGGYSTAVQLYKGYVTYVTSFAKEFQQIQKEQPSLPAGAVLRDYADQRFVLGCITEIFFRESNTKAKKYQEEVDQITERINKGKELYIEELMRYTQDLENCMEECNNDPACFPECHRQFCQKECPNANLFNKQLRGDYSIWARLYKEYVKNQESTLDELYAWSIPRLAKIESPYWNKIYAWEIKRVALAIVGNCFVYYPQPFQSLSKNNCGEDCTIFATPIVLAGGEVNKEKPKPTECPKDNKVTFGIAICSVSLDCESIEFGCSAGVAMSAKKNFKNDSSTLFIGAGGQLGLIGGSAGMKVGVTITKTGSGDTDLGGKFEMNGAIGGPVSAGKSYSMSATAMEGFKSGSTNFLKLGM